MATTQAPVTAAGVPSRAPAALRPEIQALRAGAALLVVLYHLWPGWVPGGFMGVDVFFVISGFLITAHLTREATSTGRIRLARFYARRARRLLPAAYVVLASSAAAVWVWLPQIDWVQNFREILASALYFQNWRLALDAVDYLAADNAPSAAQHYWTLSVEEQFYLAWPVLILLGIAIAARLSVRRMPVVTAVVGAVSLASFAYSWWLTYDNGSFAYFSTFTRAWEFGAGALLALWTFPSTTARRRAHALDPRVASVMSWAGLGVLVWCGVQFSGATRFPGTAALLPVLATVAVIAAGVPGSRLSPRPLLETRFVQWTGDISYPLYLWHWPPIVILPFVLDHELGFWSRLAILVGTFCAAAVTKRLIEDPVRTTHRLGLRRSPVTFALTFTAALGLAAVCLTGIQHADAASKRAQERTERVAAAAPRCFGAASMAPGPACDNPALDHLLVPDTTAVVRDDANYKRCRSSTEASATCTFGDADDPDLPHVVVIGDSHARSLLPAFVQLAREDKLFVTGQVKAGCPWSSNSYTGPVESEADECSEWRRSVTTWIADHQDRIDVVVVTALASGSSPDSEQERVDGFADTWRSVTDLDIPLVVVKDNPSHRKDPNECLAVAAEIDPETCAISRDEGFRTFDPLPRAAAAVEGSRLYDFTSFYCRDDTCPSVIGGVNVYRDATHVSNTYMTTLAPYIFERLEKDRLAAPR
jgi:peptidoglycan/LPS O-acetylase OafA/YrhL